MKTIRSLMIFSMLLILFTACDNRSAVIPLELGPQSWIDAPLDGMTLDLAPYEIVFHITDDHTALMGELSINGSVIAALPNPQPGTNMATLRYLWNPTSPGVYTIQTRAQNVAGTWGEYAVVIVQVGEPTPSVTPTLIDTSTATITPTETLTPTPTITLTPTRRPGPDPITFVNPHPNTTQIYFRGPGCGRKEVDFYVTIPSAAKASQVTVHYRLVDRDNDAHATPWDSMSMYQAGGSGEVWLQSVYPETEISDFLSYPHAIVEFYFSAVNALSATPVKSAVISSVKLDLCSR